MNGIKFLLDTKDQQQQLELKQHFNRVQETEVCVVVSSEQNEQQKFKDMGLNIEPHREKMVKRDFLRMLIIPSVW